MLNSVASLPQINPRIEFWSFEGAPWPRDWHRHVFAGRVVHKTGQLVYGQNWNGDEPETVIVYPLPARLDAGTRPDEIAWAIALLIRHYPPYAASAYAALGEGLQSPMPTPDEWQVAVALSHQISNETSAAYSRYRHVVDLLVSLLERGILRAALRPFYFGEPHSMPAGSWYNEAYLAWFATCQIDLERPFSGVPIREGGHWVVFEKDTFDAWVASVEKYVATSRPKEASGDFATDQPNEVKNADGPVSEDAAAANDQGPPPAVSNEAPISDQGSPAPSVRNKPAKPPKKRSGAKGRYPWKAGLFEKKIVELMTAEVKPASLNGLTEKMLEWCQLEWGAEPGRTSLDTQIQVVLARLNLTFP